MYDSLYLCYTNDDKFLGKEKWKRHIQKNAKYSHTHIYIHTYIHTHKYIYIYICHTHVHINALNKMPYALIMIPCMTMSNN